MHRIEHQRIYAQTGDTSGFIIVQAEGGVKATYEHNIVTKCVELALNQKSREINYAKKSRLKITYKSI